MPPLGSKSVPAYSDAPGSLVLVTDHIMAPGDFMLHRMLASVLKDEGRKAVLILLNKDWDKWRIIASKSVCPCERDHFG